MKKWVMRNFRSETRMMRSFHTLPDILAKSKEVTHDHFMNFPAEPTLLAGFTEVKGFVKKSQLYVILAFKLFNWAWHRGILYLYIIIT